MNRLLIAGSAAVVLATVGLVGATASASPTDSSSAPKADALTMAATAADKYVETDASALHISASDEVTRTNISRTLGLTFVTYERTYEGLPVVGGDFTVATNDAGEVQYSQVAQDKVIDLDTIKPAVSADKAQASVGDKASEAELVVLAWDNPTLAYVSSEKGTDEDGAPILRDTYVDAISGDEITTVDRVFAGTGNTYYNGQGSTVEIGTSAGGDGFVMEDAARPGLSCSEEGGSPFTKAEDTWGNGTGTDLETACVDALYSAGKEWDMLSEWLGRDGIDGEGNSFPIYVGMDDANAYWDGSSATFGHSVDGERQATTMDVVGHELGHGIFQNTPGGSSGDNETGGLNEGAGDIFGALTEWYANQPVAEGNDSPDYLVGEEVGLVTAGEPIRNMADPAAIDQPACWDTSIPGSEVHDANGPINHWFYLLAEGTTAGGDGVPGSTTCDSSTSEGLGIEVAGQIFMGALMGKTSGWTYTDARTAALEFASTSELFTTCAEFDATKAAFDAVTVPVGTDPTCSK